MCLVFHCLYTILVVVYNISAVINDLTDACMMYANNFAVDII